MLFMHFVLSLMKATYAVYSHVLLIPLTRAKSRQRPTWPIVRMLPLFA